MKPPLEQNYYELLEVPRDATLAEIDRAYERARAYYGAGSIAIYSLSTPEELKLVQDRIDEAYLVLADEKVRAEYDARIGPPSPDERPLHREVRQAREQAAKEEAAKREAREAAERDQQAAQAAEQAAQAQPAAPEPAEAAPAPAPEPHGGASQPAPAPKEPTPAPMPAVQAAPPAPEAAPPAPTPEPQPAAPVAPAQVAQPAPEPAPAPAPPQPAPEMAAPPEPPPVPAPAPPPPPAMTPAPMPALPAPTPPQAAPAMTPAPMPAVPATTPGPMRSVTVTPGPMRAMTPAPIPIDGAGPMPPPSMEFPEPAPRPPARRELKPEPRTARPVEVPADAVFNGEFLRKIREQLGFSVQELSDRTKIGRGHLENIEADRYTALPPQVYLRGFLMSYARELRLDPLRVVKGYLEQLQAKGKGR